MTASQTKGMAWSAAAHDSSEKPISKQVITGAMMLTEITETMAMNRQNSRLSRGRRMWYCKWGLLSTCAQQKSARQGRPALNRYTRVF